MWEICSGDATARMSQTFRSLVLVLVVALAGLALTPYVAPILERQQLTHMIGSVASATYRVLVGSLGGLSIIGMALAVHMLAIASVWSLGQAQGLALPVLDAAVLFALMLAVSILPISIGGWGLRELAVTTLLQSHGFPLERALFFSVSYGLILIIASLPGAIAWALYSPTPVVGRAPLQE